MKIFGKDVQGYSRKLNDAWLQKDLITGEIKIIFAFEMGIISIHINKETVPVEFAINLIEELINGNKIEC